jgi:hypothetical protein
MVWRISNIQPAAARDFGTRARASVVSSFVVHLVLKVRKQSLDSPVDCVRDEALGILSRLGAPQSAFADQGGIALSPITGELIAHVRITSSEDGMSRSLLK